MPPPLYENLESPPSKDEREIDAVVWWIVSFASLFQTFHFIPDKALLWLLKFVYVLLKYCGRFSPRVDRIAEKLSKSPYLRDKYLKSSISTVQYVVCTSCHTLYSMDQCIVKSGSRITAKTCSKLHFSKPCRSKLLKEIVSCSSNNRFYPEKVYSFNSIISSLKQLIQQTNFIQLCESTRKKDHQDFMTDIYDGKIWQEFLEYNGTKFLSLPYTYGFMLNVDWFQPFEHSTYSVGVIYLAILNLPRDVRYKRENIILVGIIRGPAEPPLNINTYLSPLCDELLLLWDGIELQVSDSQQLVCAALLAVSCDLPAGRKVCGFLSHAANLGCSRCYATFSEGFGQQNYARFDKQLWRFRSNDEHRQNILKLSECNHERKKNQR